MSKKKDRKGLGRGLSALMADIDRDTKITSNTVSNTSSNMLPIEKVIANPNQPRQDFNKEDLEDLTQSIASRGIIQPIIVRVSKENNDLYQIVAGERRWRAAQKAQLHEVPVVVRDFTDEELLEVAIIENVQRSNLNPVEEALAYKALIDNFNYTQEQVATGLGKSRSYIANLLRLLNLPEKVLKYVRVGSLSSGHARTLVGHKQALALANIMIEENMSVREAEIYVKQRLDRKNLNKKINRKDADTRALEADLFTNIKMKVSIDHKEIKGSGKLIISYNDLDELDKLCSILMDGSK
ncbi:ParB/RepB/Spo0J family partition protein [Amylibacter sp.]|jgi:ParB family chromosome partitioning protein|nr:ParB/RepB/Spo0J family partition protein [Amylibacter sp.]MDA7758922.1 ParB/RepB/Spo0J family partition protein [Amylibacter sp.]MDA8644834.1 ParB/RepB/Spo0J family partition protein [Amylibacter sp.]MDA9089130.1 ParB/RepB/Spo0J family partition protein [Amylibacter sp.]MDA9248848.1 ParB/RepB/Spo0J family partition protein [Amylibacter sp.]